jgi:CubicO group peptidase (beta-lactamase class C family)
MTRCRVPQDLASVTTIAADEVNPRAAGVPRAAVVAIWRAVDRLFESGVHPAIQLCVRRHGHVIIDRAIGHASGNGPSDPPEARKVLVTPETPFNIFSASKSVTAMVVHLMDERNALRLDDRVCDYIPEFGAHGKDRITLRHVLTHRAGIPDIPPEAMDVNLLGNEAEILRILCAARPTTRPGRQLAYHAMSGGFVLGEVVRRAAGKDIRTVLRQTILQPLGFRWTNYGVAARDLPHVAMNYLTGPPPLPPFSTILRRALGVSMEQAATLSNDSRFLTGVVPSGNVVTTANELSRFYQLLLNGGELDGVRVFEPRTIRRATLEQSYLELDLTLGLPFRYAMGFMLGGQWLSPYGPDTDQAFGHIGFTNIVGWADPERQVAAALMTSGKPLLYPQLYYLWEILRQVGLACPKQEPRRRRRSRLATPNPA